MYCDLRMAGVADWYAGKPKNADMLIPDLMRNCTCFLCVERDGKVEAGGTAFFISVPERSNPLMAWHYLVTARHCVSAALSEYDALYARINTTDGSSELIRLPDDGWVFPEDAASDVAVFPLQQFGSTAKLKIGVLDVRSAAHQANITANAIGIGNEVLVIGLFRIHHGTKRNIPIVRHGILSSMPEEPLYDTEKRPYDAFLVEIQSIGGLSGSPVFVHVPVQQLLAEHANPKERDRTRESYPYGFLYLLGIIRGHFDDSASVWPATSSRDSVHTGIAIVTPIQEVLELVLNNDRLKKLREKVLDEDRERRVGVLDSTFEKGEAPFTKNDFEAALKKVSKRIRPSQPDEEK